MDTSYNAHWLRNLIVCLLGSFSTLVAMTVMLPFLPLYVEQLGVQGHAAIAIWSGVAYSATFFTAALVAPLWGRLGDRYGRKLTLVRASLGMAITMSLIGFSHTIWQLVGLRLLVGLAGGYASGSMILVAVQTPKDRSAWALGMLSAGIMAGNLIGPLVGGLLPPLIGIRATFWLCGGVIFLAFLGTVFLIREMPGAKGKTKVRPGGSLWSQIPERKLVISMLITAMLLMFANMSIEPIITVYVAALVRDPAHITLVAGLAMSAAALGSILSSSRLGRIGDKVGHHRVVVSALVAAAILLIPQAFVTEGWQLVVLRFLMGVALGGLLPCIGAIIRHHVPEGIAGAVLGYSVSAQYAGQVAGPLAGGVVGGHFGMPWVFVGTSMLLAVAAVFNSKLAARERLQRQMAR